MNEEIVIDTLDKLHIKTLEFMNDNTKDDEEYKRYCIEAAASFIIAALDLDDEYTNIIDDASNKLGDVYGMVGITVAAFKNGDSDLKFQEIGKKKKC